MRYIVFLAIVAAIAMLSGLIEPADAAPPTRPLPYYAKPCATEDSNGCTWDARHRGNGIGRSFVVGRHGRVYYVTHRRAHNLTTRWTEQHYGTNA